MYQALLRDPKFFRFLFTCDEGLAEEARKKGCAVCGSRLHRARYPRKPRGGPEEMASEATFRHSFCCEREGCRRRLTPRSLRFLGRRVYFAIVVLLIAVMESGPTRTRARSLHDLVGVSVHTLRRWRRWWRGIFPCSRFWIEARGRLRHPVVPEELPSALLDLFSGEVASRLESVLRFLSPISIGPLLPGLER